MHGMHVYTHSYICMSACVHTLMHILCATWTRDLTTSNGFDTPLATVYICISTRIKVRMYECMDTACLHASMHLYISSRILHARKRTHAHTHTHTHTHTHKYRHTHKHTPAYMGSGCWVWGVWQVRTQIRDRWR